MEWDFNIDGFTKTIAEFYAQQREKHIAVPKRRTITLQFPDGLMAYSCDIAHKVQETLSVCFSSSFFLHLILLLHASVLLTLGTLSVKR